MRVYTIKQDKMKTLLLPKVIEGNHWIFDYDKSGLRKNIINIEASEGVWNLVSNSDYYCCKNGAEDELASLALSDYRFYTVRSKNNKNIYYDIYCAPTKEKYESMLNLAKESSNDYYIGSDENCHIIYSILKAKHAIFRIIKGNLYVEPYDGGRIFINNTLLTKRQKIYAGDMIFIEGLKIVPIINANSISILINNPNNGVFTSLPKIELPGELNTSFDEPAEELDIPLYNDDEYFHKSPRFIYKLKPMELEIEAPPQGQTTAQQPLLLILGPMLTMSVFSLSNCYTVLIKVMNGESTWSEAMPALITSGVMLMGVLLWPLIRYIYNKKHSKKREKIRREKYVTYIEKVTNQIKNEIENQQRILKNKYPSIDECKQIIQNKMITLWGRAIGEEDFGSVSLGYGNIPMFIDIKYPKEQLSIEEDSLKEYLNKLRLEPKILTSVPVAYSFLSNNVLGVVGNNDDIHNYVNQIMLQLITFHSYKDLKVVLFTDDDQKGKWEYMRILQHCWSNDKSVRYFATNNSEYNEICHILETKFNHRREQVKANASIIFDEIYLIVVDNYQAVRKYDLINKILRSKENVGFSIIILNNRITTLPEQCKMFVNLTENRGDLVRNISNEAPFAFFWDSNQELNIYKYAQKLANIPIEMNDKEMNLPEKVGFLEMYDIGKVESFNCKERWRNSNPILSLAAPIGYGQNGEVMNIDLHEKYHGPHGIIAGMTGSGKSEFIISYILSLALNYHPYEVQFILIDYKGGGITGAFENEKYKLPHLVGALTNLDVNEIQRSFASIESELKRRQRLFNKAREISGESTIDIYKYQRLYRDKVVDEPVAHLYIISDEFAELKSQQPEFMQQLISIARIGRSLGIHLILATQKPSGIVDNQIWSNSKFRICLRVQETEDSKDVIKCPDAAYLKHTGRFYFQVGYNEIFSLGQAAWAGGKYIPAEISRKEIDTNINYIGNIGYVLKKIPTKKKNVQVADLGEELGNIVKYIVKVSNEEKIVTSPLWKDRIPDYINIMNIIQKYRFKINGFEINIPIGEYDVPNEQEQYLLTIPFTEKGNILLYGASGSGKENFISTLIYSSMLYYSANYINYYLIDFGSQSLNIFKTSPLVGDIMTIDSVEKIHNLFKMVYKIIDERKALFAEYNGDYVKYCTSTGKIVPAIIIIINNYEVFQENFSALDEELVSLTRDCKKYGVYVMLACNTPNSVKFKLKSNFNEIFVLQQNNIDDYVSILGNGKKYPSKVFGRGIIMKDLIYEFQTAFISEGDSSIVKIKEIIEAQKQKFHVTSKSVPILPQIVDYQALKDELDKSRQLIVGVEKESLEYAKFDVKKEFMSIVTGRDKDLMHKFASNVINELAYLNLSKVFVVNADKIDFEPKTNTIHIESAFDIFLDKIAKFVEENYAKYKNNKIKLKNHKFIFCTIIGVLTFRESLKLENQKRFDTIMEKAKEIDMLNFMLIDTPENIRKLEGLSWYKGNIDKSNVIWIGPGINDQYSVKINNRLRNDIPDDFAVIVKKGKGTIVKYLHDFTYQESSTEHVDTL